MMLTAAILSTALLASPAAAPPVPSAAFFAAHREKFISKLPPGAIAVFRAAPETAADARSDSYRQDSDFWYLTGLEEPSSVAIFVRTTAKENGYILFVQPKDFAAEQWTGWRVGIEGAKKDLGAAQAYPFAEFWDRFAALSTASQSLYYGTGGDREFGRRLVDSWNSGNSSAAAPRPTSEASPILASMRLVKDPFEQDLLREASHITANAHRAAMARTAPGRHEWDLKAAMADVCLSGGAARTAYPSIVGSGRNSVVLHYERDDKKLEDGEILVNDTGCEYSLYAADVTRSYPVSGRFSPEQRKVYEIVLAAQKAGFAAVRPGTPFKDVHNATVRVVVDGLLQLKILSGDREEIIRTRAYQKFYPHGSSHWIGLNVHDVGSYGIPPGTARLERYAKAEARLEPGMALTVEPGIYIPEQSTPDPKWWNIGVRIEDTVLVTPEGMECLSCGAPREIADVEKAVAEGRGRLAGSR
jgi:Xaa-Pro aminopeptidase